MSLRYLALRPVAWLVAVSSLAISTSGGAWGAEPPSRGPSTATTPFFVKSAASLAELEKTLEGKGAHGAALLNPVPSALEIVWRHEEDYEQKDVELHDRKDHVFFVTDGQATFTLGGKLVAPREVSPGEWKAGSSIGSETIDVQKGDLVFIPSGTVHGRSAKGRRFTMLQLSFWPRGAPRPTVPAALPGAATAAARVAPASAAPTAPPPKGPRPQ